MKKNTRKAVLNIIQEDFPIASRPYAEMAGKLHTTEKSIMKTINNLRKEKLIRYFGPSFNPRKLGFITTLVAAKVPAKKLDRVAKLVSSYPEVTHNYSRLGEYNLWFTLTASGKKRIADILSSIRKKTGIKDVYNLPALKMFKIKVSFNL